MRLILPIITLIVLLLSSCSGADSTVLKRVDAIIEENPDSALTLILSIDRSRISGADLPYYALLMTQAQVKTDIPLDSDSLISIAYAEYADDWRGDKGIRSSFYKGEVFYNQEKPRDAMRHYLSSYEESKHLGNDYWRAKTAERIADLFFNAYNYPEAARYRKEAIEYFGKADRVTNQRYAIADLATDYMNDSHLEESEILLDSIYGLLIREIHRDTTLMQYTLRSRISVLVALEKTSELTAEDLSTLQKSSCLKEKLDSEILKLHIDKLENNDEATQNLFKNILSSAKTDGEKALALYACYEQIRLTDGKTFENELVDSLLFYQNAVAENIIKESTISAERDFYADMAVTRQQESRRHLIISVALILLVGIAGFVISLFLRLRNIALRSELEANVESLLNMKAYSDKIAAEKTALNLEINERTTLLSDLRHEADMHKRHMQDLLEELERKNESSVVIENLFKKQWSTLNSLCVEYFEKGALPKFHDIIIRDIESEVRKIGSKDGLIQIEEEVNRYMDGIVSKLRTECTALKDNDIIFCCLIFAGFSVKAMCFILDITSNNFYVRKTRVVKKISDSDAIHKNLFLEKL